MTSVPVIVPSGLRERAMQIQVQPFTVHKRFALTISRGTTAESTNLWLRLRADGVEGWGEASPFSIGDHTQTTADLMAGLEHLAPLLEARSPWEGDAIERAMDEVGLPSAARAALDMARHDWIGQRVGLPLWQLWGGDRQAIPPTSVTIGISSPEAAQARLRHWMETTPVAAVKVKLGSPDGVAADQAMLLAVQAIAPKGVKWSVDANGGWSLTEALAMAPWLAERGVTYLEQPLAVEQDGELPSLYERSPLPIFVDESCFTSADIPALADRVHGINIKLMKSGGLTEARRMVHTARACGLQVMFGCYSDSSLANSAAAHLAPAATHLDLDSHLNLVDDPFMGAQVDQGYLRPSAGPGLGVTRSPSVAL
jgi:L-alanine-DL-glutamate epimerase-like enolase superfamily enzyme